MTCSQAREVHAEEGIASGSSEVCTVAEGAREGARQREESPKREFP